MKKIKHTDTLIVSKEELVAFQLRYILIDHKPITETEFNVLAYVYLYGRQAIDKVVKAEILSNDKTVENIISKFRKKGLIHGIGKKTKLHPQIKPFLGSIEFSIKLKLNEELVEELQRKQQEVKLGERKELSSSTVE